MTQLTINIIGTSVLITVIVIGIIGAIYIWRNTSMYVRD